MTRHRKKLFSVTRADLEVQTFCSGGPGGQHQNKTASGVRIVHRASGAVGESRSERSQYQNKRLAMERLAKSGKFRVWINRRVREIEAGETIDQRVERLLSPENLKIETIGDDGKWQPTQSPQHGATAPS
jgi:protein subunit release factor B